MLAAQVPVPAGLAGRPYGEFVAHLMLSQRLLALGLYRRKSENPGGHAGGRLMCQYSVAQSVWRIGTGAVTLNVLYGGLWPKGGATMACPASLPTRHGAPSLLAGTRLSYVVCNPQWHEPLEATDRVFVLRPREATGRHAAGG